MTVPFMDNFRCLSNKFPYDFPKFNFQILLPKLGWFFFVEKREPSKIFGFKNVMARGIRKILIFIMHQISSENFRENNTQALEIQRRLND